MNPLSILGQLVCCSFFSNLVLAVAVERILSGGCDTILLQWASLWPETIEILMLVKKKLHLTCAQCTATLCC